MNKEEVQKRVLQNGKPLKLSKFSWNEETKTFTTNENGLVFDFKDVDNITFNTGSFCTFKTGLNCTFNTGPNCTFDTADDCTFDTGPSCTFDTGSRCAFDTGWNCMFKTGSRCTFNTSWGCVFKTGSLCKFDTSLNCTFDIRLNGYFINKNSNNIVVVRDYENYKLYELNKLPKGLLQLGIDEVIEKEKENE